MDPRPVLFVSAHRGDEGSFRETPLFQSIGHLHPVYAALNNREGLPKVYNRFLKGEWDSFASLGPPFEKGLDGSIVVFLHDDLEMLGANIESELNRWADEGFALMGLAGAARIRTSSPAIWMEMADRTTLSGVSIYHNARMNPQTGQMQNFPEQPFIGAYGPLQEVVVLDGLFLAVVVSAVQNANWTFDEDFDFHHYDLAACLRAREAGLRLRTVFVPVVHWSPGIKNLNDPVFKRNEARFLSRYPGEWSV